MATNAMMERLNAEIEELEKAPFRPKGDEVEEEVLDDPIEEEIVQDVEEDDTELDTNPDAVDEGFTDVDNLEDGSDNELDPKKKVQRVSYKAEFEKLELRYNNLRAATDQDKFQSRTKIAGLQAENEQLYADNTALRNTIAASEANVDTMADIFTEEDIDVLGDDAINVFKKAIKAATEKSINPLKAQLEEARNQGIKNKKGQAEASKAEAYNIFLGSLATRVPDWATINVEDGFKAYMKETPEGSNHTREADLADAVQVGNSRWAATFFNEYKAARQAPIDALEKKVMPKSSNRSTVTTQERGKKTYPYAEYSRFMTQLTKGKYNTDATQRKLGEQLERMYDRAYAEGRIV